MPFSIQTQQAIKVLFIIFAAAIISACSSTTKSEPILRISNNNHMNNDYYQTIDETCEELALGMERSAQQSGQAAQYLASAKAMLRCVQGIQFSKSHPDSDKALRLMALSVINFVKGGDIDNAKVALRKTQSKFPDTDLYFADYSSFFDTATALLDQQKLSRHQLAALNISADLRNEIERQQYWLSH